jgi:hypothetical protein
MQEQIIYIRSYWSMNIIRVKRHRQVEHKRMKKSRKVKQRRNLDDRFSWTWFAVKQFCAFVSNCVASQSNIRRRVQWIGEWGTTVRLRYHFDRFDETWISWTCFLCRQFGSFSDELIRMKHWLRHASIVDSNETLFAALFIHPFCESYDRASQEGEEKCSSSFRAPVNPQQITRSSSHQNTFSFDDIDSSTNPFDEKAARWIRSARRFARW